MESYHEVERILKYSLPIALPPDSRLAMLAPSTMNEPVKILFVCSQNRWRSLTAEKMYDGFHGYIVRSAGTEQNARIRVDEGHIGWADLIFTMESRHNERLRHKFPCALRGKKMICLHINDDYQFMNSTLQEVLKERLKPHIEIP